MRGEQCHIYRYLDKTDCKYKYIGISRDEFLLKKRLKSHRYDSWHSQGSWTVDYAFVESECDVQFLEGWLIAYYGTSKYFNVAKTSWGVSQIFHMPILEWHEYSGEVVAQKTKNCGLEENSCGREFVYTEEFTQMMHKIWDLQSLSEEQQKELIRLRRVVRNQQHVIELKNESLDRAYGKLKVAQEAVCATGTRADFGLSKKTACIKGSSAVFKKRFAG